MSYLSLGVVAPSADGEVVQLQNKWIVPTQPSEQAPLEAIELRAGSAGALRFGVGARRSRRHVLATDKVIKISPGVAPAPLNSPSGAPVFAKENWTYSLALALHSQMATKPILVDMESFGIAIRDAAR